MELSKQIVEHAFALYGIWAKRPITNDNEATEHLVAMFEILKRLDRERMWRAIADAWPTGEIK